MTASPTIPARLELDLGDETIDVELRLTTSGKHIRLQVHAGGGVRVVAPADAQLASIEALLADRRAWIADKRTRKLELVTRAPQLGLHQAGVVWLDGQPVPVEHAERNARAIARLVNGRLELRGPTDQRANAIERWYRRQARERLGRLVDVEAARLGLEPGGVAIRAQRTRWGSCARQTRSISLNWRLLITPPEAQRYVAVHELCHLVEPNHSKAFWRTLDAAMPDWRLHSAWLRHHSSELLRYQLAEIWT
jgi:predicted metal-dependent hydrolase